MYTVQNARDYFYDVLSQKRPLKTAKNGKITVNLYYNFIDEIYTIKRITNNTQLEEHTKDEQFATKLFYLFLYHSKKELETKPIYKI